MSFDAARELYQHLPSGLRRAVIVRRRSPLWLKAGIVFIHVPKAAGTSFNEALYGRLMGHIRASDIERWGSAKLKSLPSFAITRNPWDRLLSAYRFVRRGGGLGGANAGGVWRAERYRVPEFETFERFVFEWLAPRDLLKLDYVFQPQSLFVCDVSGKVVVDHLGRFENLRPTHAFLREKTPQIREIPGSNKSGDHVDYRSFYTPELVERIASLYATDVQRFGYSFE